MEEGGTAGTGRGEEGWCQRGSRERAGRRIIFLLQDPSSHLIPHPRAFLLT